MIFRKSIYKSAPLLLLFMLYSCSASNLAGTGSKPSWVEETPASDAYYIGIGMANKDQDNYIRIAKNNALSDMISEISVNISGNSVLRQFEDRTGFREEFESITKMSMKEELEGYEMVDSYNGKKNYWVYYRMSVDRYHRIKKEKLERAKNQAKDYFEKAKASEKKRDIHNALNLYVKAFDAIKGHLEEDLSVFMLNEGRIELGNAIYQNIQEIFSKLNIVPAKEIFKVSPLAGNNPEVRAIVYYGNNESKNRISGLPFILSFPGVDTAKTEQVQSNSSGEIICSGTQGYPVGKQQKIKSTLNTEVYFGEEQGGNLLKQMFSHQGSVPYGYITIDVAETRAYYKPKETEFGDSANGNPVSNLIKEILSEHFFSFVAERSDAEVIIHVSAHTQKGKKLEQYNLHTAYLNCRISITDAQNDEEIYSKVLQNIKGMKSGSFHMAARDAGEKAKKQIQQQIIPELRQINF